MTVVRQETFGPVSPIIRFKTVDEAIRIANGTAYGLSSSLCTNRIDLITRFIQELQVGSVNVREVPGYRLEMTPFGGIKDSGLGYKEGVLEAMKSFCNTKTYSCPGNRERTWAVQSFLISWGESRCFSGVCTWSTAGWCALSAPICGVCWGSPSRAGFARF